MILTLLMGLLLRRARRAHPELFDSRLAAEQVRLAILEQS